jgi:hypothetical protein
VQGHPPAGLGREYARWRRGARRLHLVCKGWQWNRPGSSVDHAQRPRPRNTETCARIFWFHRQHFLPRRRTPTDDFLQRNPQVEAWVSRTGS